MTQEAIDRIRAVIEQYPYFIQNRLVDGDGDVCVIGALYMAACAGPNAYRIGEPEHDRRGHALTELEGVRESTARLAVVESGHFPGVTYTELARLMAVNDIAGSLSEIPQRIATFLPSLA